MNRRIRNILLFLGSAFGTALLIAGIGVLLKGDRSGWTYIVGAVLAFVLAFAPGRRLRDAVRPPDA